MHFTVERGTDIDAAMRQISAYLVKIVAQVVVIYYTANKIASSPF